jgi:hypothetical protein
MSIFWGIESTTGNPDLDYNLYRNYGSGPASPGGFEPIDMTSYWSGNVIWELTLKNNEDGIADSVVFKNASLWDYAWPNPGIIPGGKAETASVPFVFAFYEMGSTSGSYDPWLNVWIDRSAVGYVNGSYSGTEPSHGSLLFHHDLNNIGRYSNVNIRSDFNHGVPEPATMLLLLSMYRCRVKYYRSFDNGMKKQTKRAGTIFSPALFTLN